jgi:uncharacterized protein (TIGR02646 family)
LLNKTHAFMKENYTSKNIKDVLIEQFNNKCAYCGTSLGDTNRSVIDHFYPKSKYPDRVYDIDNLILSCRVCDLSKSDRFPTAPDGSPLLINPRFDNIEDYIKIDNTGLAIPLNEKGKVTIDALHLNRVELIEDRKIRFLEKEVIASYAKINKEYYSTFQENLEKIKGLANFSEMAKDGIQIHLLNMLFSNAITSLETYLCDAFINTVRNDKNYLRKFVESFHNFRNEKFELTELFKCYDSIEEKSVKSMLDVIYHDLPKVKGMYNDTLNVKFPEFSAIYKAVLKRHDFVHRNGKTKNGKVHNISKQDVEVLCSDIAAFVENINDQLLSLKIK